MNIQISTVQIDSQTQISLRRWLPDEPSILPPILLVHGYGEHIARYDHVGEFLTRRGFDVWGYDARGHGVSQGTKGVVATDGVLVNDCVAMFSHVAKSTGRTPIVVAHSMGGLTAGLAVTQLGLKPAALVLSSPLLRVRMSGFQKFLLNVGLVLFKDKAIHSSAVNAIDVSRDAAVVQSYRTEPLNHAMVSPRLGRWMSEGGARVLAGVAAFDMPILLIYAGDDRVVDASGSDDLAKLLPATATARRYDKAYHEIFNEPLPERDVVLAHMSDWLLQSVVPHE